MARIFDFYSEQMETADILHAKLCEICNNGGNCGYESNLEYGKQTFLHIRWLVDAKAIFEDIRKLNNPKKGSGKDPIYLTPAEYIRFIGTEQGKAYGINFKQSDKGRTRWNGLKIG